MIYIGIDNGISGGLVAITHHEILAKITMPLRSKNKGNEVCAVSLIEWVRRVQHCGEVSVVLEVPGKFAKGTMSLCSMWDSYGCIRGAIESHGIRMHHVHPKTWQSEMIPGCAKGKTKPAARSAAKRLWPGEGWLVTTRCTKDNEGLIDAALIAEYGRRKNL